MTQLKQKRKRITQQLTDPNKNKLQVILTPETITEQRTGMNILSRLNIPQNFQVDEIQLMNSEIADDQSNNQSFSSQNLLNQSGKGFKPTIQLSDSDYDQKDDIRMNKRKYKRKKPLKQYHKNIYQQYWLQFKKQLGKQNLKTFDGQKGPQLKLKALFMRQQFYQRIHEFFFSGVLLNNLKNSKRADKETIEQNVNYYDKLKIQFYSKTSNFKFRSKTDKSL